MNTSRLHGTIVFLVFLIVCIFISYYVLYRQINASGQHILNLSQQIEQNSQQGEEMKNLVSSFDTIEPEIERVNSYFIPTDGEVSFIDHVQQQGEAIGVSTEIQSVGVENSKELTAKHLQYLTMKVSAKGSWSHVYAFILFLENQPYSVSISQADINSVSDNPDSKVPLWQGSFEVKVLQFISK